MTSYAVFGEYESQWTWVGYFDAHSPRSAIKIALENGTLPERIKNTNSWVAVPARSWKPVTVKVETKTALKFS